ncbi:MAG: hypothetical protein RJB13_1786, partial [Pseudomonadota bacterium]
SRILCFFVMSWFAALSFSSEAFCDSKTQSNYVVSHPFGLFPSVGLEVGQRSSRDARGFDLEINYGFNSSHFFVGQLFMGYFSKEKYGGSFFVKQSYGLVIVDPDSAGISNASPELGAGAAYKIGNEWEWPSGLIFGVGWVGIGGSVSLSGEGTSATVTPYLLNPYVGWSF